MLLGHLQITRCFVDSTYAVLRTRRLGVVSGIRIQQHYCSFIVGHLSHLVPNEFNSFAGVQRWVCSSKFSICAHHTDWIRTFHVELFEELLQARTGILRRGKEGRIQLWIYRDGLDRKSVQLFSSGDLDFYE